MNSNQRWSVRLLAITMLGLLPAAAWALTVTGRVNEASDEHVVVGGTHFMIDESTRVFLSPDADAQPRSYRPAELVDVFRVRVNGINRVADRIVILPFGYDFGESP